MRLLHGLAKIQATFDDPNLVSRAGLMPVMALAQRAGLARLAGEHVRIARRCGVNAQVKVGCLVAGMIGGADSIDDMDLLRHGAMPRLFGGIRAPSTLGSFLRSFTWGNVLQLGKVSRVLLAELAGRAPLLPGKDVLAFVDIDSMQKRVYGHKKQGAGFGHTKIQGKSLLVRGLNALAATISTPLGAPVIAATRLRGGTAGSARGAASFATEAVRTARATGCSGILVVRADSAFYSAAFTGAVRRAGAFFSVTVQMNPHVQAAIAGIGEDAWRPIKYPRAIWDDQLACWVSDAEVGEVTYTAFTSKKGKAITARLIVRRVKDLNRKAAAGQDELFCAWRYHAVFTGLPFTLLIWSPNLGVFAVSAAGVLCAFSCVADALPGQCLRRRPSTNPLVAAVFRTKRPLREHCSATCQRRRRPGQARHRQGRLQIKTLQAEEQHRDHAQVEQVLADWTDGPLAHLPSGSFPANAAWLALAAISHNLLRAAGSLASLAYAKARGATLRRDLIDVAARTARHGHGEITLHLPEGWHRQAEWMNLFQAATGPPAQAA